MAIVTYDNLDQRFVWEHVGTFATSSGANHYGGNLRYLVAPGHWDISFTGTRIIIVTCKDVTLGIATVALDGGGAADVDLYASAPAYQTQVWDSGVLEEGVHTVVFSWTGRLNASAYSNAVSLDAIIVYTDIPAITVVSPNGGETWANGSVQTLSWSLSFPVSTGEFRAWVVDSADNFVVALGPVLPVAGQTTYTSPWPVYAPAGTYRLAVYYRKDINVWFWPTLGWSANTFTITGVPSRRGAAVFSLELASVASGVRVAPAAAVLAAELGMVASGERVVLPPGMAVFNWIERINVTPVTPGAWVDTGLAVWVPAGIAGAIFRVVNATVSMGVVGIRKNGSTDTATESMAAGVQGWVHVGVDANRTVEIYQSNVQVWLVGYYMDRDAVFFTDAQVLTGGAGMVGWTDVDVSALVGADTPVAVFVRPLGSAADFGFRKNGSTDDRHTGVDVCFAGVSLVAVDGAMKFETYNWEAVDVEVVGYLKTSARLVLHTDGISRSLEQVGAFADLAVASVNAASAIYSLDSSAYGYVRGVLRADGSPASEYDYITGLAGGVPVQCGPGGVVEGKIANLALDFYEMGYEVGSVQDGTAAFALGLGLGGAGSRVALASATFGAVLRLAAAGTLTVPIYPWGLNWAGPRGSIRLICPRCGAAQVDELMTRCHRCRVSFDPRKMEQSRG